MSIPVAQCPPRNGFPALEVVLATSEQELDQLYRLRKQIYVDEMGVVAPEHPFVDGERLVDPYDAWSVNLVLLAAGRPAGSVRLTEARAGALEIDAYTQASARCPEPEQAAEATRLMVSRQLRGSSGSALLLFAMWKVLRSRCRYLLAAAKPGGLGAYYKHACAAGMTVFPERFEYGLTGCQYELILADTGTPLSPRRLAWRAWIETLALLSFQAPARGLDFVRSGRLTALRA